MITAGSLVKMVVSKSPWKKEKVPINTNNSLLVVGGGEYFSREIREKLHSDGEKLTIKDGSLYIGQVVLQDQFHRRISLKSD